jgi:hypothetical protein
MPMPATPATRRRCARVLAIALALAPVLACAGTGCGGLARGDGPTDGGPADAGPTDAAAEADAAPKNRCVLSASSYDRSCHVDSDCSAVWFGNVCTAGQCVGCEPNGAISASATEAYENDLDAVVDAAEACPCPPPPGSACCDQGTCVYGDTGCGG